MALEAASRLGAADTSLFGSEPEVLQHASERLGWPRLASQPPYAIKKIVERAHSVRASGLDAVVLVGQGGSSQAAMTLTKLHEVGCAGQVPVAFKTMDSLSPVFVNHILGSSDPARTLYIISSKSGSTIEVHMLEQVVWRYVVGHLGAAAAASRFVAITDPGSPLTDLAADKHYRFILPGPVDVGGRFSALTTYALLPAALVGIDIEQALQEAAQTERFCCQDSPDNPALQLACFLYDAYQQGRDKFSLVMPPSGQVFGLWVEQMVAESLGKQGIGILPNVEVDASILASPRPDRSVITYAVGKVEGFAESLENIHRSIPRLDMTIDNPTQAFANFVVWEYATAFLGILMEVFPFDQPDVEQTKAIVRSLLVGQHLEEKSACRQVACSDSLLREMHVSEAMLAGMSAMAEEDNLDCLLRSLLTSIEPGDYFAIDAFLPFRGYGRREALERMRNRVASRLGVASCLEIGPRYLHSTGQLQKGGQNNGVFLMLSADELDDIVIPRERLTLGTLAAIQARADFTALALRNRRVIYAHLAGNDAETLSRFADRFCAAVSAVRVD
ncbi:MAG: glucose-6-phosphate isomerase [Actinomycetia bacterium]|nr:glucose-6-phosphate isomerase [Actinomycetes bacterium]